MQNPTRDELRTQIQNQIRDAIQQGVQGGNVTVVQRSDALDILRAEIAGVRAEIQGLTQQLTPGLSNARENAVEAQIERATERLVRLEDQLTATATGRSVAMTRPPMPPGPQNVIPEDAKEIAIWGTSIVAVTIVSVAFIRMWSRWLDRRSQPAPAGPDVTPRLDRIEQAIEAVAIEVERISEGQRYTSKMLHDARALPAPGLPDRWPAAAEREPVPARRQGEE